MSTPVPDTAEGGRLHLLGLPAELQTMIFELAYERSKNARLIMKKTWSIDHRPITANVKGRAVIAFLPYPGTKVNDFLVSKQYFVMAARAYVLSQPYHLNMLSSTPPPMEGILLAFAKEVVGEFSPCWMLPALTKEVVGDFSTCWLPLLPNVRTLKLTPEFERFVHMGQSSELPILLRLVTAEEFVRSNFVRSFSDIREVTKLEVVAEGLEDPEDVITGEKVALSQEQKSNWRINMKTLEKVLQQQCCQPKPADAALSSGSALENGKLPATPLYFGSRVNFEKSAVRDLEADNTKKDQGADNTMKDSVLTSSICTYDEASRPASHNPQSLPSAALGTISTMAPIGLELALKEGVWISKEQWAALQRAIDVDAERYQQAVHVEEELMDQRKKGAKEGRRRGWAITLVGAVVILLLLTFLYVRVSGRVSLGGLMVRFEVKYNQGKPSLRLWCMRNV